MLKTVAYASLLTVSLTLPAMVVQAQDASQATTSKAALPALLGTITSVDSQAGTIHVKEDKTGTEYTIDVGSTRTLLKVAPGAADLKGAVRITAADLQAGDRVSVRGAKDESTPDHMTARSVILMSARELDAAHKEEAASWSNSTAGTVVSVVADAITINTRSAAGPKPLQIKVTPATKFTRYSTESPSVPAASKVSDIQAGDQVRVLGEMSPDGTSIAAKKIYSGAFRTTAGTIVSLAPDGKQITLKNLQTGQPTTVAISERTTVRKMPPMMAAMVARRFNPSANAGPAGATPPGSDQHGGQPGASPAGAPPATGEGSSGGPGGQRGPRSGDLSRMIERIPQASLSDLKVGDALVVSGALGANSQMVADVLIAGVEPIFQAAPAAGRGRSLNSDWSLDMSVPAQ